MRGATHQDKLHQHGVAQRGLRPDDEDAVPRGRLSFVLAAGPALPFPAAPLDRLQALVLLLVVPLAHLGARKGKVQDTIDAALDADLGLTLARGGGRRRPRPRRGHTAVVSALTAHDSRYTQRTARYRRRCPRGRQPPATDEVGRCLPRHCPRSRAETGRCPRSKQLCVCRANDLSPRDEEAQQQTCLRNLPSDSGAGGAKVQATSPLSRPLRLSSLAADELGPR